MRLDPPPPPEPDEDDPMPETTLDELQARDEHQATDDTEFIEPFAELRSDEMAEHHLRKLKGHQDEYEEVQGRFDTEIARLMARADRELQKIERRISWHEGGLKAYYVRKGQKRLVMANATLSSIKGRPSVDVPNPELLETWCVETGRAEVDDLFRRTKSPDKKKIMAYIKETGEEPPGCRMMTGADSFKVKF